MRRFDYQYEILSNIREDSSSQSPEAAVGRCSAKKMFLEIS